MPAGKKAANTNLMREKGVLTRGRRRTRKNFLIYGYDAIEFLVRVHFGTVVPKIELYFSKKIRRAMCQPMSLPRSRYLNPILQTNTGCVKNRFEIRTQLEFVSKFDTWG